MPSARSFKELVQRHGAADPEPQRSSQGAAKMTKSPFDTLMEVSTGFVLPRTLHVIAELGIADALEGTPRSAEALAAATGTNAEALNRALRVLSAHGIFAGQGGVYAHTPSSLLLRSDHPQSMRSFVRMQGIPTLWHIWEHFAHALRTGRSAAEKSLPDGLGAISPSIPNTAAFSMMR